MKDYNFTLFHKSIDNVCIARSKVDKAKMELICSTYEADYTYKEDCVLHDVRYKMETVKSLLDEICKDLCDLERGS